MIRRARRRAPKGRYRTRSFVDCPLPPCVAVTAIGEVLGYAFDPRNGPAALERLFARAYRSLVPGGLLIFDLLLNGPRLPTAPLRRVRGGEDWSVQVEIGFDRAKSILTREITSFRRIGRAFRRDRETHRVHLLDRERLLRSLRQIGFRVQVHTGYGEQQLDPWHRVFLAHKPN